MECSPQTTGTLSMTVPIPRDFDLLDSGLVKLRRPVARVARELSPQALRALFTLGRQRRTGNCSDDRDRAGSTMGRRIVILRRIKK